MKTAARLLVLLAAASAAFAAEDAPPNADGARSSAASLPAVARDAVEQNPEIRAAVNGYLAALARADAARGGYLPRIDIEAGIGRARIDDPRFRADDFSQDRVSVVLTQMLYDGFTTRNTVRSLDHAARSRFFEVWATSERITAEVARAYLDVLRQRAFVELSKDNYATHRLIYEQIERRVLSGISRRVDLDQAYGRLALAESNLLTDITNLHDVSRRYQRVVGATPPPTLGEPELRDGLLPDTLRATLATSFEQSPALKSAQATEQSADRAAAAQRGAFQPRLDLRARQDTWHDREGISGRYEDAVIELVLTYNLYRGGSDSAERRRLLAEAAQAEELRELTCRNIRQEIGIAYNEMQALAEQLTYLDRHRQSIGRAREAYRRQFDIGQRTLLDMLDTENEYYEAERAWVTAQRQRDVAYTETLAGMGALVEALELGDTHADLEAPTQPEDGEAPPLCAPESPYTPVVDKDGIYAEMLERRPALGRYQDGAAPGAVPAVSGEASGASVATAADPQDTPAEDTSAKPAATGTSGEDASANGYYQLGGDGPQTLWSIAFGNRPAPEATVEQTMVAILQLNPDAFVEGNLNRMRAGSRLKLPTADDALAIDADEAKALVRSQTVDWRKVGW
ncbi:MAG: TolC family outer membrane protein [Gammaproteobacteria bacterium]